MKLITLNPNAKNSSDTQFRQAMVQMRVLGFELSNVDPYRVYPDAARPNYSKVTVRLNGGLYVTEKTRNKFKKALQESSPARKNRSGGTTRKR